MTDEELRVRAIQELEFYKKDDTFMLADITVDLAIEALEQLPSVNLQPCEEAINREDALMCLTGEIKETDTIETIIARFVRRIRKLPPVTPQPKNEDIAKAFQLGMALGFAKKHDEMDKVMEEVKKTATPQPKTGHWEWLTENKYRCSNCKHETRVDECMSKPMYDFCPFCRARMESED